MDLPNAVLAHKLGLTKVATPAAAPEPPTPMRQMRRALGRAADKSVSMSASVLGIAAEISEAEALIEDGPDDWVVLGLRDASSPGLTGLFLVDPVLRSALIEMQTMGRLMPAPEEQRKVTRTDAVMVTPFAACLLGELAEVGFGGGAFNPASYDIGPIDDLRTAGLVMVQGEYRHWRITIQMGGTDAQGEILIAFRSTVASAQPDPAPSGNWAAQLRQAVHDAPAELDAVLTRMTLPIHKIEDFEVGQLVHLAGTTVGSVMLTGPGGEDVAHAKLGQVAGKRAVRLQQARVELQDAPPKIVKGGVSAPQIPEPSDQSGVLVEG